MRQWKITYDIADTDSGDFVLAAPTIKTEKLRLAVEFWDARTSQCDGGHVEANDYPIRSPRWFTKTFNEFDGDTFQVSLHVPESVTLSSRRRLARVLGVAA